MYKKSSACTEINPVSLELKLLNCLVRYGLVTTFCQSLWLQRLCHSWHPSMASANSKSRCRVGHELLCQTLWQTSVRTFTLVSKIEDQWLIRDQGRFGKPCTGTLCSQPGTYLSALVVVLRVKANLVFSQVSAHNPCIRARSFLGGDWGGGPVPCETEWLALYGLFVAWEPHASFVWEPFCLMVGPFPGWISFRGWM